ncbi:MAG: ATP-dependent helicase HrpB [Spirochaetales bacterium]|nr:ATP-dependent helicase HrpB [Spirochaetales bacterium]
MEDLLSTQTDLPIFPFLDKIHQTLERERVLLLSASPGAGKTTLVPAYLLLKRKRETGKILLLEPRRIAARAAAERIAWLLGEKPGRAVGLHTRTDNIKGRDIEVVTEGVLTRIVQNDPSLKDYAAVLFDEFHERSIHADLGLALTWQVKIHLRPDLMIMIMSATLSIESLLRAYGDIPVISVPGRIHDVEIRYRPPGQGERMEQAAARLSLEAFYDPAGKDGDVLVFLPGFREINRTRELVLSHEPDIPVSILHGRLPPGEQREVITPGSGGKRRIILSTNVAETSVTLPQVKAVIDLGYAKRSRFCLRTGMQRLELTPVSTASAEQRKGRAGRTGPGICYRWWKETEFRQPETPPEIVETDLASLVLETALWGARDPFSLIWVTPPPVPAVQQALEILNDLKFIDENGVITHYGKKAARLGIHPRLGRMLLDAENEGLLSTAAVIAAILENDSYPAGRNELDMREHLAQTGKESAGSRIIKDAKRIMKALESKRGADMSLNTAMAGKILLSAYPDRIARKTGDLPDRESLWALAGGQTAVISNDVFTSDYLSVAACEWKEDGVRILLAAPLSREVLEGEAHGLIYEITSITWKEWTPRSVKSRMLGKLRLSEQLIRKPDVPALKKAVCQRIRKEGINTLPWTKAAHDFRERCLFAEEYGKIRDWPSFSEQSLLENLETWLLPFACLNGNPVFTESSVLNALRNRLQWDLKKKLDRLVPGEFILPSGKGKRIAYPDGKKAVIAARVQEFFGLKETPVICGIPATLHLLSPAGRVVQITDDITGFWKGSYKSVQKEMKGRYPKHYWPDNPAAGQDTTRKKREKR